MVRKTMLYLAAALAGIMAAVALSAVFTVTSVTGSSMEPAVKSGSHILINKLAYGSFGGEKPQVGDVVAFGSDVHGEDGEGSVLVRRVVGAPGDKVEIKDDIFYLNGKPYEDHMVEAVHMEPMDEVKLGEEEIFVLSDDRSWSMDSRNEAIGVIDIGECIGKVCFR